MKKFVTIIFILLTLNTVCIAQRVQIQSDTTNQQILNELQIIRSLQEESRDQRYKIFKEKHKLDSLQNKKTRVDLSTDYGIMSQIEDNTRQDNLRDGWNFYGIVSFVIAVFSIIIAVITLKAQKKNRRKHKEIIARDSAKPVE